MEDSSGQLHQNQYSLSIRFNSDGFSLWIFDESNALLSTKSISCLLFSLSEEEINTLMMQEIETTLSFKSIRLICESDNYCFVPAALFRAEEAADYLNMQSKPDKNQKVLFNSLDAWDMVAVFSVSQVFYRALSHLYPNLSLEHHLSALLTDKVVHRNQDSVCCWVREKMVDILVLKDGNVLLVNSYGCATTEDFTYFILNVFEQLSLNTETCKVKLFNSEKKMELRKQVQLYVKSVICE